MQKTVKLLDGNKEIISIDEGYCCDVVRITKGYIENNILIKSINLSIWDDISFSAYCRNEKGNKIDFEFDINDPLYFCLNRFIDTDKFIIIDSDHAYGNMNEYMMFKKEDNIIKIEFYNNTDDNDSNKKYNVFVKNIGPDCRSKIEDFNLKKRIVDFFSDCQITLMEDEHQICFDEYIETLELSKRLIKNRGMII